MTGGDALSQRKYATSRAHYRVRRAHEGGVPSPLNPPPLTADMRSYIKIHGDRSKLLTANIIATRRHGARRRIVRLIAHSQSTGMAKSIARGPSFVSQARETATGDLY